MTDSQADDIRALAELSLVLSQAQSDQYAALSAILMIIVRGHRELREKAAETLRLVITRPAEGHPLSEGTVRLLRTFREELLADALPELSAMFSTPNLKPVE